MSANPNQEMRKIARKTLALVLAGTFTFSGSAALADENNSDYETVRLNTEVHNEADAQDINSVLEVEEAKAAVDRLETEMPALIPGDFFYFAKIALEKIKLAFTFNQAKEAELLADYASERLAEASSLFAEGREETALETIKDAIKYIKDSQLIVEEDETADTESKGQVSAESPETDEAEIGTAGLEGDGAEEDLRDKPEIKSEDPFEEAREGIRQNILVLTLALEKVKNPKAKAALQKNIKKAYAKMDDKLEEERGEFPESRLGDELDTVTMPDTAQQEIKTKEKIATPVPEAPAPAIKAQQKQEKQAEKQAAKQEKSAEKTAKKAAKKAEQAIKKAEKKEAKAAEKKARYDSKGKQSGKDQMEKPGNKN